VKVREVIKEVQAQGWVMLPRTATNHRQFVHPILKGKVTISGNPGAEIKPKTLSKIREQARGQ
jgi:predicted RNA binding protein YcfA (HicA-like mRNA interferase family)